MYKVSTIQRRPRTDWPGTACPKITVRPLDINRTDSLLAWQNSLSNRPALLRPFANKYLKISQNRYKPDHGKSEHSKHIHVLRDYVFVDKSLSTTSEAEHLAAHGYSKLTTKWNGSYLMLSVGPDSLKVLQEGFENFVCIRRVACIT